MASKNTKTIYRSSVTGRVVKASYANAHQKTTERQHVHVPPAKKK